jgi:hypothetical protein
MSINQGAIFIHVPPVIASIRQNDATAATPVANRVQRREQTTDGLGKVWVGLYCPSVVRDGVLYATSILHRVRKVRQGNVERAVTQDSLLVHLNGKIQLTYVFQ